MGEATEALAKANEVRNDVNNWPDYQLEIVNWLNFKNPADADRLREGLRKAGVY